MSGITRKLVSAGGVWLLGALLVALSALPAHGASVSGVSGSVSQGSTITISGSSFGSGPTGVVFDDFELGTDGHDIMTGSGSARVGQWSSTLGEVYYTNDYKVSGSLAFEADMSGGWNNYVRRTLGGGCSEVFGSWWVRMPDPIPGENDQDGLNYKHIWILGSAYNDDDVCLIFIDPIANLNITGDAIGALRYTGFNWGGEYQKGDWLRMCLYLKGGLTDGLYELDILHENGSRYHWDGTGKTWGNLAGDGAGLPRAYEVFSFNDYGRQTSGSYPRFDDCYSTYGSSCRARVEIGNASSYANCTDLAICGPTSWSSSSITAKCNVGGLDPQDDWYLFVVDASGNASSGYNVSGGGGTYYTLTVNSGSGDGSYTASTNVNISANSPASGYVFDCWVGNTSGIANVNASSTTLTMPAANQTITATYEAGTYYSLTVNSGSGDGSYTASTNVNISADAAPSGHAFDCWVGNTSGVANVNASSTTLTMPAANQTITATYEAAATYTLTVNSGSGDGNYTASTNVNISADAAASGYAFDCWVGNTSGIANVNTSSTTLTMPAANQTITATYEESGGGGGTALLVDWGSSAGANDFDFSDWDSVFLGIYTGYSSDGPDGLVAGWTGTAMSGAVSGSSASFASGDVITVTWYNAAGSGSYTFTPKISFDDPDYYGSGTGGTWYDMTQGVCPAGQSITTTYTFSAGTAGNYSLVNVCRYTNAGETMVMDKIELTGEGGGGPTYYTLTVNSGSGDGDYEEDEQANISADSPPAYKQFDHWVGDTSGIANVNASSTTLTMPAADQTITATYTDILYTLTVNSGSGDGSYAYGTNVNIAANSAPSGYEFDEWTGNTSGIADVDDPTTSITMPGANATVTATYASVVTYTLTVDSGSGDGNYAEDQQVNISADSAASGMFFDKWAGSVSGVADVNDPTTTIAMPASNATVTATYTWVAGGLVSRLTFDADASDSIGSNDGTLTNGAAVATDGERGKVVSLDGDNDYVALPSSAFAAGRSEMTLCMWVRPDTWVAGDTLYDEYAEGGFWQFTLIYGGFYTRDSSTGTTGSRDNDIALPGLATGEWQHVAVVYSTSNDLKAIYIDGEESTSTSTSIDTLTSTRGGVGVGYAADGTFFDGMVDDLRLYNRALSEGEIALVAGITPPETYTLTVNSGSGDGEYEEEYEANISADSPPAHMEFDEWAGDIAYVTSVTSASTTVTMPADDVTITATYTDILYTLTVNSGSGDGSYAYAANVGVSADSAPAHMEFDEWVGDTACVTSVTSASTTVTMPGASAEITATYTDILYTLTVNSGSGSGSYAYGANVNITANSAPSGYEFDDWTGNTSGIADVDDPTTSITMPGSNATVTATYSELPTGYALTVNSGSGDGYYDEEQVVNISADTAPSGMFFDVWTGDTAQVADFQDPTTSVTMPAASVEVTARFTWVASGLVTRYTFDVDGSDMAGSNDATLINGAAVTTDGERGKVLSMDGSDDYVVLPTSGMTAGRSELTLSMWIKPDENVGTNAIYDSHYDWYWQFAIRQDGWYTRDSSTGTTGSRNNDLSMPTLSTGEWQHLAFVYSAGNDLKAIYLDGEPAASTSTSVDTLTSERGHEVLSVISDGTFFDGMMDDLRLYSRALSEDEIELLAGQ